MTASTEVDRVREFYDDHADQHPRHPAMLGEPNDFALSYRQQQELAVFWKLLPLGPRTRLIEFGSGGGRWLQAVAPLVHRCVGVELSSRCVELSQRRLNEFANVKIHQSAIQDYELQEQFDVLYYSGVLLYLSDPEVETCLEKHMRNLSHDGWVLIRDTLSRGETHDYRHPQGYRAIYRSFSDWQRIMKDHSLELVTRSPANMRPISNRARNSRFLRICGSIADWFGMESAFIAWVARLFGSDPADIDNDPGYSHDFLLCCRENSKA